MTVQRHKTCGELQGHFANVLKMFGHLVRCLLNRLKNNIKLFDEHTTPFFSVLMPEIPTLHPQNMNALILTLIFCLKNL